MPNQAMAERRASDLMSEANSGSPFETSSVASGPARQDEVTEPSRKARRAFLTQNACSRCRQKKSKCDGVRPSCGRCEKHATECMYDVALEGMTRMQNLQQQLASSNEDNERLRNLFRRLKESSDQESTTLLARLRLGDDLDELLSPSQASPATTQAGPLPSPSRRQSNASPQDSWPQTSVQEVQWIPWSERCDTNAKQTSASSDTAMETSTQKLSLSPASLNRAMSKAASFQRDQSSRVQSTEAQKGLSSIGWDVQQDTVMKNTRMPTQTILSNQDFVGDAEPSSSTSFPEGTPFSHRSGKGRAQRRSSRAQRSRRGASSSHEQSALGFQSDNPQDLER